MATIGTTEQNCVRRRKSLTDNYIQFTKTTTIATTTRAEEDGDDDDNNNHRSNDNENDSILPHTTITWRC